MGTRASPTLDAAMTAESWTTSDATVVMSVSANKQPHINALDDDTFGDLDPLQWDELEAAIEEDDLEHPWSPKGDDFIPWSPLPTQAMPSPLHQPQANGDLLRNSRPSTPVSPQPVTPPGVRQAYEQVRDAVGRILTATLRHARANQQHEELNKVQALIQLATEIGPNFSRLQPHAKGLVDQLSSDAMLSQYATVLWWTVRLLAAMQNGDIAHARFPEYRAALEKGLTPLGLGEYTSQ